MDITSYLLGKKAGGGTPTVLQKKEITITQNGEQAVTPDTGYNGLSEVDITTNVQPNLESKSVTINTNTTTTITPTSGKDGLSSVEVTTNIPQPSGKITITQNGTDIDVSSYASADVNVGGGEKNVFFYDYDGTELYSYSKEDFLALTEMPSNPTHEGLISQGWNWSLEEAKTYFTDTRYKDDRLDIGQLYTEENINKTNVYIKIDDVSQLSLQLTCSIANLSGQYFILDWGDGSPTEETSATGLQHFLHTYSNIGEYKISIETKGFSVSTDTVSSLKTCSLLKSADGTSYYNKLITKVELGYYSTGSFMFSSCHNLETVVLFVNTYNGSTSNFTDAYQFAYCFNLKALILSKGSSSFPFSKTMNSYIYQHCHSLKIYSVPSTFYSISGDYGNQSSYVFAYCYSLEHINMGKVSSISGENIFTNCYNLKSLKPMVTAQLSPRTPLIQNNYNIDKLYLNLNPSFAQTFSTLTNLKEFVLTGSAKTINMSIISCYKLEKIIFETAMDTITLLSIGTCPNLKYIDFSNNTQVPTGTISFANSRKYYVKIVVPDNLYNDWIVASNWSAYADIIVRASDYFGS